MQHRCEGEKDRLRDHIEISEIITASFKKTRVQMNFSSKRNNMSVWIVCTVCGNRMVLFMF